MARHSIILCAALLSVSLPTHGQSAYTYNDTGACTSRTKTASPSKARAVQPTSNAKITVIDFPTFGNTLTIKADSIGSGMAPTCVLSDVDGVAVATLKLIAISLNEGPAKGKAFLNKLLKDNPDNDFYKNLKDNWKDFLKYLNDNT